MNFLELTADENGRLHLITLNTLHVCMCVPKGKGCVVKMSCGTEYRVIEDYEWVKNKLNSAISITGSIR